MMVKRRFMDVLDGQIHYREAGSPDNPKLMLLHASPGSSKQLELLAASLGDGFHVIAPDTLGNGDSMPPLQQQPEIADYAAAMIAFADGLGWKNFHLYGTHTGARIATWLALNEGSRVNRLILDGFGLYTPQSLDQILDVYAPNIVPDTQGLHVLQAWQLCRDQYIWFPWFRKEAERRVPHDLPNAEFLHNKFVEVIKGIHTYHKSYLAAFRYSMRDFVPQIGHHTLITCSENDLVRSDYEEARGLLKGAKSCLTSGFRTPEAAIETASAFTQFLLTD